ncbi:MAG: DUF2797 domain-containing protein, partial [Staphylothermus sp.]|nr:DUF2797 domain-containing protein [Staphylothermus sp.]
TNLSIITCDEKIMILKSYTEYCHWHNGLLDKKDNPLTREYCIKEAVTELGYCMEHKDSLRAIYTKCFSTSGLESLRNCWLLDEKLKDKIEYTVYLLAYAPNKFKVGTTRKWRLYERIGEQPHIVATMLYNTTSAVKARDIEIKIGKLEGLTEKPRRRLKVVIQSPLPPSLLKLEKIREKILRIIKLGESAEDYMFRIEPLTDITYYIKAKEKTPEQLVGKPLLVTDYYAGYLLLSEPNTNEHYIVKANSLLHTSSIKHIQ